MGPLSLQTVLRNAPQIPYLVNSASTTGNFTAYCCEGYAGASPQQIFGPLGLGVSSSKKQSQLNNNVAGVDV